MIDLLNTAELALSQSFIIYKSDFISLVDKGWRMWSDAQLSDPTASQTHRLQIFCSGSDAAEKVTACSLGQCALPQLYQIYYMSALLSVFIGRNDELKDAFFPKARIALSLALLLALFRNEVFLLKS